MKTRTTTNLDVIIIVGSILLTELMLVLAMVVRLQLPFGKTMNPGDEIIPTLLYVLVGLIWFCMLMLFAVPRMVRNGSLLELLWRLVAAVGLSAVVTAGMLYLSYRFMSRLYFVYFIVLDLLVLLLFYGLMRVIVRRNSQQPDRYGRVLVAGVGRTGLRLARAFTARWNGSSPVVGFLDLDRSQVGEQVEGWPVLGTLEDAASVIEQHQIDEIVIALPLEVHPRAVHMVRELQTTTVHIRLVPDFLDFAVMRSSVEYLEGLPIVGLRVPALSDEARIAKRIFDMLVSAVLITLLSPLLTLIALLIRLDSPGPAIYRAERMGENGKIFRMFKFRTMARDAEARWDEVASRGPDGKLYFKRPSDPRITRVGRWLRRTSLDELPQLFNVLKGDMSLVGPRPEQPFIVRQEYEPWQWSRFTVPQGMTGWWQINRRGYEQLHLCTADDLYYIQNYSLWLDLQILFRTVFVVFNGRGSY